MYTTIEYIYTYVVHPTNTDLQHRPSIGDAPQHMHAPICVLPGKTCSTTSTWTTTPH